MNVSKDDWRHASRGFLHQSPTITDDGVLLGYGTVLVHRSNDRYELEEDAERFLCLASIARRRPQAPAALHCLRRALASWQQGDKALAHIHLAFGGMPRIEGVEQAWCLHHAEGLIDLGMAPRVLAKELGFAFAPSPLSRRYDPNEPRNPKDNGRASGEWTKDPVASGSIAFAPEPASAPATAQMPIALPAPALAPAATAPSLIDALGAEALEWLSVVAGRVAMPVSLFGAVFVPSPNVGTSEQGAVPDRPGMSYSLDRDTGTLRLSLDSDPDPGHALVAQLGADGIYRHVETKVAIARAVGSSAVIIDLDRAPAVAGAPNEKANTDDEGPKLCPDPSKDQGGGRKLFDIMYEQWVRDYVNPQRKPQLAPGLAFALPTDTKSGWVHYDDCREATGGMVDAKGNYAPLMSSNYGKVILRRRWLEQAASQIEGAKGRKIDWYFHDRDAAGFAAQLFLEARYDKSISVHYYPYPGGVPKYNPRVKL